MYNSEKLEKIKIIIRTFLLIKGPTTAKELCYFINNNNFKLGHCQLSTGELSSILKEDIRKNTGVLQDLQCKKIKGNNHYIYFIHREHYYLV